jgi:hypothetical protein
MGVSDIPQIAELLANSLFFHASVDLAASTWLVDADATSSLTYSSLSSLLTQKIHQVRILRRL